MAVYLWLKKSSRKQIMKDNGLANVKAVNVKYLPKKFHTDTYYKETDIVLRNLRRLKECEVRNFKLEEFKCGCGRRYCSGYPGVLHAQLLINLQEMRDTIGKPITIMSAAGGGMRCKEFNSRTPGSIPNSRHTKFRAVDLQIPGMTDTLEGRQEVMEIWKDQPKAGYTYCNVNGSHPNMGNSVHVEV